MNTYELLEFIGHQPTDALISQIEHHFDIIQKNVKNVSLEAIFSYVAVKHKVNLIDLQGKSHKRIFVLPRHEGCYLACILGYKVTTIAKFLNRDHSTVINARETVSGFYKVNKTYRIELEKDLTFLRVKDEADN